MNMLTNISLVNSDELLSIKVDVIKFKDKYPLLFENYKESIQNMDRWEVEEIIPETDSITEVVLKEEAVLLYFEDGIVAPIYNIELIRFNGLEIDGYSIKSDSYFVYFIISIVSQQAGSIGIWSIDSKEWVFTHRDDGLCVESIVYVYGLDCFVGFAEWRQYASPPVGNFFFLIDSKRRYSTISLPEVKEFDWGLIYDEHCNHFINEEDSVLGYDEQQAAIFTIRIGERRAYRFDAELIN